MKDSINRIVFPTLEDDIRMSTLMTRFADHCKQQFAATPTG